jgi:hypothetical protein
MRASQSLPRCIVSVLNTLADPSFACCPAECFVLPHMIHAGLALIATLCFIFVAVVMTIADFELNPLSSALLASPASVVELRAIVMKTAMCVSSALLDGRMKMQSVVIVGAAWLLFWSYLRWVRTTRPLLTGAAVTS